ncbi:LLM class flavin-dependent oxidoreductase [Lapillicoccus jejuensis]|uniref:Luciferase-like monooxygenase n=1 Tax=Lapillicoccus jejuensis TaxID=402171 RepID=A0A542DWR7_9MICO|nr:LLM class flavin-dependent oxidoreductase [Lapillicoccus jejuensis]TQJ07523.1 luciferase-like monooxygenase [Lapillicoccus jejuensis]
MVLRHAFVVPMTTERELVELAVLGEEHGWDMVLSWEAVLRHDAWVALGAAALSTSRIRLGTMLTPASRWRPWDLARVVGSVDRLSAGRVTLGVGLGAPNGNWLAFEPDEGRAQRARLVDEVLEVYRGLLTAGSRGDYTHEGERYAVRPVTDIPPLDPVQRPHPPVWVVGALVPGRDRQRSLERAARWQGVVPAVVTPGQEDGSTPLTPSLLRDLLGRVRAERERLGLPWEGYDVVVEGDSHGGFGDIRGPAAPWEDAGATWWVESWWDLPPGPEGLAELRRRVRLGPRR